MKKIFKKVLISFVLLAMCAVNIPSSLYADDAVVMAVTPESAFTFSSGKITAYDKAIGGPDVVIPSTIGGVAVTTIGYGAFEDEGLASVILPDSIQTIEGFGFAENSTLSTIKIPSELTIIEWYAFDKCGLETVDFTRANKLVTIDTGVFRFNKIKSVEFPDSLRAIGEAAFQVKPNDVDKMTFVKFNEGLQTIGKNSFWNNALTEVYMPDSITSVGNNCFAGNKIETVKFSDKLTTIADSSFQGNQIEALDIPDNILGIENYAFADNKISNLRISKSAMLIGQSAFMNNALTEVEIPASVKTIVDFAFMNNQLSKVTLNEGLEKVGEQAFENNHLAYLHFPTSVKEVQNKVINNQKVTGKYSQKGDVWEFDFDDISSEFFIGDNEPFRNMKFNGVEVNYDKVSHVVTLPEYPNGKTVTYDYLSFNPLKPTVPSVSTGITVTLEPKVDEYTVTFDGNSGTPSKTSAMVSKGGNYGTLPTATRPGWDFRSWNTKANGTGTAVANDQTIITDADHILYADWYKKDWTVEFNTNEADGKIEDQLLKTGDLIKKPNDPTKKGYTFGGWFIDSELTLEHDFVNTIVTDNMTLHAKWISNNFTVNFVTNGASESIVDQTVATDQLVIKPNDPTRTGYIFSNWFSDAALTILFNFDTDKITEDTSIYAGWTARDWTVSFDTNEADESISSISVRTDQLVTKPADPTRNNYIFNGWFKDAGLTIPFAFDTNKIIDNTVIYAGWIGKDWTVSFDTNGSNETIGNQIVKTGNKVLKPADPTKNDYIFNGWFKDTALSIPFDFNSDTISGNAKLYAKWLLGDVIVSFDTNGANESFSDQAYHIGDLLIKPADPTRIGFTFNGWFKDEALTIPFDFSKDTITTNMKLYAKWVPNPTDCTPISSTPDKREEGKSNNIVNSSDEVNTTPYFIALLFAGLALINLTKRGKKRI